MASKRQRGESSRSSPPFDKKRFVNFVASQRYHTLLSTKNLIPERGLTPHPIQDGDMAAMISTRKWQVFTTQPGPAAVNVVKEFYANAKAAEGNSVFVRGKWVKVGRKVINKYYGLPKIKDSGYAEYLENDLDYSVIIESLCEPGTEWKSKPTLEAVNFSHGKLSRYGKAWYGFICAKLMPTLHKTDVTKERAALLYCLVTEKSIDVGAVIHATLAKAIDGTTSGGLPYPSLITDLCKQAGVQWDKEEVLQPPIAEIDHSVIARFKVWEGGMSNPKGLGYIILPTAPDSAGPSEPAMPSPDIMEALRRDSRHHSRRIDLVARQVERATRRMDRQHHRIAKRQAAMHTYNVEFNTVLLKMFVQLHPSFGSEPCPLPPVLPMYPPSDNDTEEEDADSEEDADIETDDDDTNNDDMAANDD